MIHNRILHFSSGLTVLHQCFCLFNVWIHTEFQRVIWTRWRSTCRALCCNYTPCLIVSRKQWNWIPRFKNLQWSIYLINIVAPHKFNWREDIIFSICNWINSLNLAYLASFAEISETQTERGLLQLTLRSEIQIGYKLSCLKDQCSKRLEPKRPMI